MSAISRAGYVRRPRTQPSDDGRKYGRSGPRRRSHRGKTTSGKRNVGLAVENRSERGKETIFMAVMRNDLGWYSTMLEKTFDSEQAARHYELREIQSRTRRTPEQEEAENLKPEVVRALYNEALISEARKEASIACHLAIDEFHVLHPEYIDSPANSAQMRHYFTSRGIESPSLEIIEEAYSSL